MRAIDRDLIRAGHYGQRPGVPHSKAEHMAAPTKAANVKKVLANSEPSTHGTKRTLGLLPIFQLELARCAPIRGREFITFAGATAAAWPLMASC